jgi:hypothetical protein
MAKDMVCKLCESEPEQEVGIMLISDLTGSGQLPFAVGLNCMTDFLTGLLETFAQPEGITPSEPSELEEDDERDRFDGMESTDIGDILAEDFACDECGLTFGHEADCETGATAAHLEAAARDAHFTHEVVVEEDGLIGVAIIAEDPTAILEPSGPSPAESSAPDTGNGSEPKVKRSPVPGHRRTSNVQSG